MITKSAGGIFLTLCLLFSIPVCTPQLGFNKEDVPGLILPEGFSISYFAKAVPNARSMCFGPAGVLYVGTRGKGNVYAVFYDTESMAVDSTVTILKDLNMPNGVAYKNGKLYVAEVDKITSYDIDDTAPSLLPEAVVIYDQFPSEKHHGWKYIAFGPDDKLYVPVGAPCNVCLEDNPIFGTITRLDLAGGKAEIIASGVRNSVGFDWQPYTGTFWFTDNGRDWLGDDAPSDELNRLDTVGSHFGFPYCHEGRVSDPDFGSQAPCEDFSPPFQRLGAHVASLGMKFYRGKMFPESYHNKIIIAEHGSWNRSVPSGYRLSIVDPNVSDHSSYTPFVSGWLKDGKAWGRPVALLTMPDGSLLVSDDHAGNIYRISYEAN